MAVGVKPSVCEAELTIAYNTVERRHAGATAAAGGCTGSRWERLAGSSEELQSCRGHDTRLLIFTSL